MLLNELTSIYVLHHKPNIERKKVIIESFNRQKIQYEFIEDFLPNDIQLPNNCRLTKSEYSLYCKLENALEKSLNTDKKYCIIFEDDIVLNDNFPDYFELFIKQFESICCDILMIGDGPNLYRLPNTTPGQYVYTQPGLNTRYGHAILYKKEIIECVLKDLRNEKYLPIDHKLNIIISNNNIKVAWLEPGLPQSSIGGTPFFKFPTSVEKSIL